ncbi:MAG: alpha/beta hydrolase [Gemmatimonadota bacterium]
MSFERKWAERGRTPPGTLEIISNVYSPELGNTRDIVVYTPRSYEKSESPFPVIYMHDGQNLFDPWTSFAGEWGVDLAMARAPKKGRRAIVVGIPNMGIERMREYSPFLDERHGGGAGDAYVDFILDTLKPMIDLRYRTDPSVSATGIMGSSLGALISLYAFFRAPASFGFCGAQSPALWFGGGQIFRNVQEAEYVRGRIYLDVGAREGEGTLLNARNMRDLLLTKGYVAGDGLMWVEDRNGRHNEAAWGRRLRKALPFLLDRRENE